MIIPDTASHVAEVTFVIIEEVDVRGHVQEQIAGPYHRLEEREGRHLMIAIGEVGGIVLIADQDLCQGGEIGIVIVIDVVVVDRGVLQ